MDKIVQSTLEVEYEGDTWVAEWCSFIIRDGTETKDRWLKVSRKEESGVLTSIDDIHSEDSDHFETLIRFMADKRVKEIQSEYGIAAGSVDELAVTEQILARVWEGEWMGQLRNSYYFFIDTLGEIFNKDFLEAADIVAALNRQEKAGLNGFIIVPWQEEEDGYKGWEETTGHKKLSVGDSGGWGCQHCGNHAYEEGPWAAKVPCVPTEDKEITQS